MPLVRGIDAIQQELVKKDYDPVKLQIELEAILERIEELSWAESPALWMQEKLGEFLWSKQQAIAASIVAHPKTAVPSCFNSGKSFLAGRLAAWWIDTHPIGEAFVVTTAPTFNQVKAILWKEIGRAHTRGKLQGRLNQTEWMMDVNGIEEMVAFGKKPADMDATAFQGIHERYVLVILDEAAGVPSVLYDAALSLISNRYSRMIAIGNPEDASSEFARICSPGSGWNVIRIPAFETPNFTEEEVPEKLSDLLIAPSYVEDMKKNWGEGSARWKAKILAQFPDAREDGLIPINLIIAAQERTLSREAPSQFGLDVGGGINKTVIAHRQGGYVRIIHRDQNPNTMSTCGTTIRLMDERKAGVTLADEVGIGKGIVDRARELKKPIIGINVGMTARDSEHFVNIRAEGFWNLRRRFEEGTIDIDPNADDLKAQLAEMRFKTTSSGKIQIESKAEMKRRNVESPDDADAIMLAFLPAEAAPRSPRTRTVMWG